MQKKILVCPLSHISPTKPYVFIYQQLLQIVIFQTASGYFAVENRCPHAGAQLQEGQLEDTILTCHWHGWSFDLESGQCLNVYWARLKKFEVQIESERLYLWIEE